MPKKYFWILLGFLLVVSIALMAAMGESQKASPIKDVFNVQAPMQKAACTMNKALGTPAGYWSGYEASVGTYTYYDPAVECGSPAYPFEITAFSLSLYDDGSGIVWPVTFDVVVYDMADLTDPCAGPGAELCRYPATADAATYTYPAVGTIQFPSVCCVNNPVFIGIEYTSGDYGTTPSVIMDDVQQVACDGWMRDYTGVYYEWYTFWTDPAPGYPLFWVDGDTQSPNCGSAACSWNPGDAHKMHFPQLPDEAGWDVNATAPMVLADDFMCMQTGPITDVHWWGGWRDDVEGTIINFVLSIHADIPAEQNPDGYSKPGVTLWEMEVLPDNVTPIDPPSMEGWYDPATGEEVWNSQAHYWQYDVCIDPVQAFYQDSGTIYWLNISAIVADPAATTWGWKSTEDHWNDDAVWGLWGELNWIDIWEPAEPLVNGFAIAIDPMGTFLGGGGSGAYGDGWYFYPQEEWWNIWFYDHPFDSTRYKYGQIFFDVFPSDPGMPMWIEVAVNWSTDQWSLDHPDDSMPPLPGVPEELYIGRQILFQSDYWEGPVGPLPYEILDYNPEWVSIDVRGWNFEISNGIIEHTCKGSLDLAFVITGEEPPPPDSGACCVDPTGGPPSSCIYTTQTECEQVLGGFYQGNGVLCAGVEACCMPNGDCIMADALCCVNELGGSPQGAGSTCQPLEACCFPDGACQDLDPLCCVTLGGTPQGFGTVCQPVEACCFADGNCRMLDPLCCVDQGGTPQGFGTDCSATIACCFPDGTCQTVSRVCCDDMGGTPSPFGAPMCLGDLNGDGFDDACVIGKDLKWRQAPDLDPTGIDVDASCPGLFEDACIVLADDFECIQTGPITEVHVYGSWWQDAYPMGDPGMVMFTLSFHLDVPAGIDLPYSHPGPMEWIQHFNPDDFVVRPYAEEIVEGFYDPLQQFYDPAADWTCWEYIFYLNDPFIQQGTEIDPVVYWLDVQAMPEVQGFYFGWKTSTDHWNDDGVFAVGSEPVDPLSWGELRYPESHPWVDESIDLAFEIYGEADAPCDCIPGDANGDGMVNVGDAVYLIAYVFQSCPSPPCPPPTPYALCSGDANCDCAVNVGDAVYIISYVFKGGPPPCDCPTWLSICGPPLRK